MTKRRSVTVDTPLGALYVWSAALTEVQAATLPATVKHDARYRHDPAAQRAAETVFINDAAYTLTATLRAAVPGTRTSLSVRHGWWLDPDALRVRAADRKQLASPAVHRQVARLLLPPMADWLAGPDGRAFLLDARIDVLAAEIHTRSIELTEHHAERDRLIHHQDD